MFKIVVFGKRGPFLAKGTFSKSNAKFWVATWNGEWPVIYLRKRDAKRLVLLLRGF